MSRACWMYRGVLASAVFTVRDHMMTSKIISIALAGACLLACSNAWSWWMNGDTVEYSTAEWEYCKLGGTDAALTMLSRQKGTPLSYPYDNVDPPSETQKKVRVWLVGYAETYPIESTEEKKMAVADKFSKDMQRGCLQYLKLVKPEDLAK